METQDPVVRKLQRDCIPGDAYQDASRYTNTPPC